MWPMLKINDLTGSHRSVESALESTLQAGVTFRIVAASFNKTNPWVKMRSLEIYLSIILLPAATALAADNFPKIVQPFLARNCIGCHNEKNKSGEVNFQQFNSMESMIRGRETFENLVLKVRSGEMPPKGLPRPKEADVRAVTSLIESEFDRIDRKAKLDPGRVTARRLNKTEYNNTIRDLLAVRFKPADDFPADDSGYGFDNIGDVLTLSPVLLDKYLAAAEKISKMAVDAAPHLKATAERFKSNSGPNRIPGPSLGVKYKFPVDAEYDIRTGLAGQRLDGKETVQVALAVDGKEFKTVDLLPTQQRGRFAEVRIPMAHGEHTVRARLLPPAPDTAPIPGADNKPRTGFVDYVEVRGPYKQKSGADLESYQKVFICGHAPGQHQPACARKVLSPLATRAYRRPATEKEVSKLVEFVELARKQGDPFEQGIALAIQAVLVSPQFLFRMEHDRNPNDPTAVHTVSEYELASRLSYFLWSGMPDDELLKAAQEKRLRKPGVLDAQVKRMMADPKSKALSDNFAGQWLQLRNMDSIKPDPDKFPAFDEELRECMRTETELFFDSVLRENRSLLDFVDGKYTFLNERLARHYGIDDVKGSEFRRVDLKTDQRSGVLTQASILTITSYPTRTSVVLRGKWLMENVLNAPPPPPPPNVPMLDEATVGNTGSLRQQMEKHRANAMCASCHNRIDPLGFGLENYDPIGRWRTSDGKFPVDSTGTLPSGKSFKSPEELKEILKSSKDAFAQGVTEKLLTYALGRGLERYDRPATKSINQKLASDDYRFGRLISEIVNSAPFQMRRGDGVRQ
jgi:mono/diheme cytochrome c family protein